MRAGGVLAGDWGGGVQVWRIECVSLVERVFSLHVGAILVLRRGPALPALLGRTHNRDEQTLFSRKAEVGNCISWKIPQKAKLGWDRQQASKRQSSRLYPWGQQASFRSLSPQSDTFGLSSLLQLPTPFFCQPFLFPLTLQKMSSAVVLLQLTKQLRNTRRTWLPFSKRAMWSPYLNPALTVKMNREGAVYETLLLAFIILSSPPLSAF